ncbi:hypothetical protein BU24DRAFT_352266 [Aaosphaeria arxii CBS 175.79]|uniref:Cytochrome P450 n=1 Tax=Aaosphaeria arxii CBS 175.79 TaxID=1450172 RepID=A0A6A5XID7_9PLEO|nr:uncharacterized protein BU24DRAFT_352266 [Aaosphaeria arxii CBS 175.79]KAF2012882.1 hypothetical protein BU24DRAFT_352266 [Aaosphaeria arxii CBS 175.79]
MPLSPKTVFFSVYGSHTAVRLAFLPLCYFLVFSPFLVLLVRYYGYDQEFVQRIPSRYRSPDALAQVFAALVTVGLFTRILTGTKFGNGSMRDGHKRNVNILPYWIPRLRHTPNLLFRGDSWLSSIVSSSITDIVGFSLAGIKHVLILSPSVLDRVVGNTDSFDQAESSKWSIISNSIGLPSTNKAQYLQLQPEIRQQFASALFKGEELLHIVQASVRILSESLPDLITFNSSLVDQLPWERVAGIELSDGTEEAECDLYALVNEYFSSAIITPITGLQFTESYQLLASDLATLDESFYALALGLPRFFPLPGLPGATLARRRLLQNFTKFFHDITFPPTKKVVADDESVSGDEDTDAETPTPMTVLNELFSQHDVPMEVRAAIALEAINKIRSQAVPLAFWVLYHIYSSSEAQPKDSSKEANPLEKIRGETKVWAHAVQPPSIHPSFPSPPQITFDAPSSLFSPTTLPFLRSTIFEASRLYSVSVTTAVVTKPIIFTQATFRAGEEEEKWQLDVGSCIDVGLSRQLINRSAANYLDPQSFKPDRFAHTQSPSPLAATVFEDSNELVNALLVTVVAGITQLWDISAAPKKSFFDQMQEAQAAATGQKNLVNSSKERNTGTWQMPNTVDGASCKVPKGELRVRIRRRENLEKLKIGSVRI